MDQLGIFLVILPESTEFISMTLDQSPVETDLSVWMLPQHFENISDGDRHENINYLDRLASCLWQLRTEVLVDLKGDRTKILTSETPRTIGYQTRLS